MAIRTVLTRGFGNGTFNGTIPLRVTRGYTIGVVVVGDPVYCDHYAFMSAADTPVLAAMSAADTAKVAELTDIIAVYAVISDADTVTISAIDGDDVAVTATLLC